MEFKYLNDGRKVVVIGQLNNQESIVQEVFVTGKGDEIPSGERFVTKSLHDEPVQSYKAREEERLAKQCKELEATIKAKNKELGDLKERLKAYQQRIASTDKLVAQVPEAELEAFAMFLSGSAEYLVFNDYGLREPIDFHTGTVEQGNWNSGELKLLSVFGKSNGDLSYRVNSYSDGSGGWSSVTPCRSYEHALEVIKGIAITKANEGRLGKDSFDVLQKLGIELPPDALEKYKEKRKEALSKSISNTKEKMQEADSQIRAYEAEIQTLETPNAQ